MKLPEVSVNRPVMTLMIFLGILLLGIIAYTQLQIDIMPKIEVPTIGIITSYPGASAEDVEKLVTKVIEPNVAAISNVTDVISKSQENVSSIILKFNWGTNLDEAANDVRQGVDFSKRLLPDDAEDPTIMKFDLSQMPVYFIGLNADESYDDLYDIADDKICDALKRLPGVAAAFPMGGERREIKIDIDRDRLKAYSISLDQVIAVLSAENISMPAGDLKVGSTDFIIRTPGEFENVEKINNVVVGSFRGSPIHIRDIAEVKDSFKDIERRVRVNKKPAVLVLVQKQSNANTVEVAGRIKKELREIKKILPPDIKMYTVMDSSEFIKKAIFNLGTTIAWAILFVVLVVFIFLRDLRGSFIVGITIPFSLVLALIFLYLGNFTINMMSLSALAIAIGMVVDNAIVIFENIYYHRLNLGESARESSIFGTSEVGLAVTASTATTVAIFVPVIFIPGITGVIFKELAYAAMIVLAGSLICALSLTPMISSRMALVPVRKEKKSKWDKFRDKSDIYFRRLEKGYQSVLGWALNHRKTVLITGLAIFALSLGMIKGIGTEFIPASDQGEIYGTVELPVGTRIEVTDSVMAQIEDILAEKVPELMIYYARCGLSETGGGAMVGRKEDVHIINIGGKLVPKKDRKRSDRDIGNELSKEVRELPGVSSVDFTPPDFFTQMTSGGEKPVSIEIYGEDLEQTERFANELKQRIAGIKGLVDLTVSRKPGKPEIWVEIDREKASMLGLNTYLIANTLRSKFAGTKASLYRERGKEYDITVKLRPEDRASLTDLLNTSVTSPVTGAKVPLRAIATLKKATGPMTLERKNQERVVYVGGGIYGRPLGNVINDIKNVLAGMEIPQGIDVKFGGTAKDQASSFKYLFLALILGIILVYMVMASQFESLVDPFVIMFAVPFAISGVIWALLITGKTLSMTSFVGMIMLVGIVVNNGIVLVDFINILRARGLEVKEAILTAGARRLRPVLMTSLTTILALIPLAARRGEGSEVWSPLAVAVIGGLLVSLTITLIFVPTLYSIVEERLKGKRVFGKKLGGY